MAAGTGKTAGAIRGIERFGASCLRRNCLPVNAEDVFVTSLLADLWKTLDDDGGVGLAAPQIGKNLRVVIVRNPAGKPGQQRMDLINPQITSFFGLDVGFEEGCLSFPGLYSVVKRSKGITVEYQDATGKAQHLKDDGLLARIIQHEVDHLDGVLFIDRLPWYKRWLLIPRLGMIRMGTHFMEKKNTGKEAQ